MTIRVAAFCGAVCLLSGAAGAQPRAEGNSTGRVGLSPAANLAGRTSGKALGDGVRKALAALRVPLASGAELSRAAKLANVKLKRGIQAEAAGKIAAKGHFTGVVVYRKARVGAFADLVDRQGQVALERLIRIPSGQVSAPDLGAFATAVAESLQVAVPAPPPPVDIPPPPPPPEAALVQPVAPPPPPIPENAETAQAYAGPETAAAKRSTPAAGFVFRLGVSGGIATRLFLTPSFSYVTSNPYPEGGLTLELYPFTSIGLGIVASASYGIIKDQIAGQTSTFNSTDLRGDIALAYRLQLFPGGFGTVLIPRLGFGLRNFEGPASAGVTADDRIYGIGGLSVTQPLVPRYLRVTLGGAVLPFSKQSSGAQTLYGDSTAIGFEWSAELGGDLALGLEWAVQAEQERFLDSYSGPANQSGVDIFTNYTLQLRLRI